MPKEITHFLLAHKVLNRLPADSRFFDPVHRFKDMFMYGSVLPDSGFYYLKGPQSRVIQNRSEHFHKDDSSCLQPVLDRLNKSGKPEAELMAFAAGICCHLTADTVFHPMVYYFSGISGRHKDAVFRHRLFETALDMHVLESCQKESKGLEPQILKHLHQGDTRPLSIIADLLGVKGNIRIPVVLMIMLNHQLAYWVFRSRKIQRITAALSRWTGAVKDPFAALFYPEKKSVDTVFFINKIRYRDPVDGSFYHHSVEDMIRETITRTLILLKKIEENMISSQGKKDGVLTAGLPHLRPTPSLDENEFVHWYGQEDITALVFGSKKVI